MKSHSHAPRSEAPALAAFERALQAVVGQDGVRTDAPLAPLTTFRAGGSAD